MSSVYNTPIFEYATPQSKMVKNLNWNYDSIFFSFSGPSSKFLELQSLSYDSNCTDTSCVNDELEGSSHQSAESIAGQRMSGENSVLCFSNVKIGPQILTIYVL